MESNESEISRTTRSKESSSGASSPRKRDTDSPSPATKPEERKRRAVKRKRYDSDWASSLDVESSSPVKTSHIEESPRSPTPPPPQTETRKRRGRPRGSKASTSTDVRSREEVPPPTSTSRRGRPRGRGRGRGRGRSADVLIERPAATEQQARGGRRGRGGRRATRFNPVPSANVNRAQDLEEMLRQRKERIKERVQGMKEDELRSIVQQLMEKIPGLLFDVVEPIPQQPGGYHPGPDDNVPEWCRCGKCREMPTALEKRCCERPPHDCITTVPDFILVLDEGILALGRAMRNDMLAINDAETYSKANRHQGYRQYILLEHGKLGEGDRRVIPSCAVWAIRDTFPDPFGQYKGFVPSRT